jgi:predicted MFS family arabinose efflux permease
VWAGTVGAVLGPNLLEFSGGIGRAFHLPELTGPYLLAGTTLLVGAVILFVFLRPDPFLHARSLSTDKSHQRRSLKESLPLLKTSPLTMLAISAIVIGHISMVSIMVMTPVHMRHVDVSLRIIGLVISVHIIGMFAFSPIMGWLSDRLGRVAVIRIGVVLLLLAGAISAFSPAHNALSLGLGLFLLGLGWSATLVAGSTLLVESLQVEDRPSIQGVSDLLMNAAGALGGAISGIIIATSSYAMLCFIASLPVAWLGFKSFQATSSTQNSN